MTAGIGMIQPVAVVSLSPSSIAAIWTTGPSDRIGQDQYAHVGDIIRRHARAISEEFGHQAPP